MKNLKDYIINILEGLNSAEYLNVDDLKNITQSDIDAATYLGDTKMFGRKLGWDNNHAFPLIFIPKINKLFIGNGGQTHLSLSDEIVSSDEKQQKQLFKGLGKDIKDIKLAKDLWQPALTKIIKGAINTTANKNVLSSRVWWFNNSKTNVAYLFIAFWEELTNEETLKYVNDIISNLKKSKQFDIDLTKDLRVFLVDNEGNIKLFSDDKQIIQVKRSKETKNLITIAKNLHLATQQEKREALAAFRKTRDDKNAEIYKHTKSGTEAEWRSLMYQESKSINEANWDTYQQNKYKDELKSALYDYVLGFTSCVNDDLRKGKTRGDKQVIDKMDRVFKSDMAQNSKLDLYRTIDWDYMKNIYNCTPNNIDEFIKNETVFQNKGYMSTTNEFHSPWGKSWQDNELVLHLTSKNAVPHVNVNNILPAEDIDCEDQKEYLLPRDIKMILKSFEIRTQKQDKRFSKNGTYVLEMEII